MTHKNIFKSLQAIQLISLMSNNVLNTTMSLRAYNEFTDRYETNLKDICKRVCKKNNFDSIKNLEDEIYRISIQEIYLNSRSFQEPKRKLSSKSIEKLIFGWFANIAEKVKDNIILENNEFEKVHLMLPDYHNHLDDMKCFQKDEDEIDEEKRIEDEVNEEELQRLNIFRRAIKRLKPRERDILTEYNSTMNGSKNLSSDKIAYLCKRWGTTIDNLQHIKPRATKKLYRLFLDEQKKEDKRNNGANSKGESI